MIDYEEVVREFQYRLNFEIDQTKDTLLLGYTMGQYIKGNFTDSDLTELKGYRNGLKVAGDILLSILSAYEGEGQFE